MHKTFADAVIAKRELEIKYLWIGSLCIIQDNTEEWKREAEQVGSYYTNSLLTLSAAHGEGSAAGLFRERDSLVIPPCLFDVYHNNIWRPSYAYARDTSFLLSKANLSSQRKPLPLYSRAGGLQEQMVPPRTLTYGWGSISWRCQTTRFNERDPLAMTIESFIKDRPSNLGVF
jgi:hypothetical protein